MNTQETAADLDLGLDPSGLSRGWETLVLGLEAPERTFPPSSPRLLCNRKILEPEQSCVPETPQQPPGGTDSPCDPQPWGRGHFWEVGAGETVSWALQALRAHGTRGGGRAGRGVGAGATTGAGLGTDQGKDEALPGCSDFLRETKEENEKHHSDARLHNIYPVSYAVNQPEHPLPLYTGLDSQV